MGRCVIQLDGKFMEWTSVSDGPVSPLLTEVQFRRYWREEYGRSRWHELAEVLMAVKARGTSARGYTVDEIIKSNRAGKNDTKLTKKQIINGYTPSSDAELEEWFRDSNAETEKRFKEWEAIFTEREKRG